MKLPSVDIKLPDLPRQVTVSLVVLIATLVIYGVLYITLGRALNDALARNKQLTAQIQAGGKRVDDALADLKFVQENQDKYEKLIQSEVLVPHTRRDAARQISELARQEGLTALSFDFGAAPGTGPGATGQVQTNAYRVDSELINLKVGAPLDGIIYRFLVDVGDGFPGAVNIQAFELKRASRVTGDLLSKVSAGQDSGLVSGDINLLWRTAQQKETVKK